MIFNFIYYAILSAQLVMLGVNLYRGQWAFACANGVASAVMLVPPIVWFLRRRAREAERQKLLARLAHRDDMPYEVVEAMERVLAEQFPGMKLTFAGDVPGGPPPEILAKIARVEARLQRLLREGRCIECGVQMPDPPSKDMSEDWRPADGWCWFTNEEDQVAAWQCPQCDADDDEIDLSKT